MNLASSPCSMLLQSNCVTWASCLNFSEPLTCTAVAILQAVGKIKWDHLFNKSLLRTFQEQGMQQCKAKQGFCPHGTTIITGDFNNKHLKLMRWSQAV